jgi:hypothetical protein
MEKNIFEDEEFEDFIRFRRLNMDLKPVIIYELPRHAQELTLCMCIAKLWAIVSY